MANLFAQHITLDGVMRTEMGSVDFWKYFPVCRLVCTSLSYSMLMFTLRLYS